MAKPAEQTKVRSISNAVFGAIAGRGLRAYSLVGHVGRVSGREHWTPVSAYPLDGGFVIPVLYGRQSQWVLNALAAGRFRLRTKGEEHLLVDPQVVPPARAMRAYPGLLRRVYRAQGINEFVWARSDEDFLD